MDERQRGVRAVDQRVVVAAGNEGRKAQLERGNAIEHLIKNDGEILAARGDDRLAQAHAAGGVLPDRKNAAPERHQPLETARVNDIGKAVRGQVDAVDGFVEFRHQNRPLRPSRQRGHEHAVIAARVRERH